MRRASAVAAVAGLVLAFALLAVAAAGGPGGREIRPADSGVLLVAVAGLLGAAVVGLLAAMAMAVYALWPEGPVRPPDTSLSSLMLRTLIFCAAVLLASYVAAVLREAGGLDLPAPIGAADGGADDVLAGASRRPFPWAAAAVGALATVLALAARARRGMRSAGADAWSASSAEPLEEVLDRLVVDLRTVADPRAAVIAAYAQMVELFTAHARPPTPAEAPGEYLQRVLPDLGIGEHTAHHLRMLYELARFSPHPIRDDLRRRAGAALDALREELEPA